MFESTFLLGFHWFFVGLALNSDWKLDFFVKFEYRETLILSHLLFLVTLACSSVPLSVSRVNHRLSRGGQE